MTKLRPFCNTYEVTIILKDTRREGLLSLFLINNRFLVKTKTETKPVVLRGVREPECSVEVVELREKSIWTKHNRLSSKHVGLSSMDHRKYGSIQYVNSQHISRNH